MKIMNLHSQEANFQVAKISREPHSKKNTEIDIVKNAEIERNVRSSPILAN